MPVIQYHGTGVSSISCTGHGIADQILTPPSEEPFQIRFTNVVDGEKPTYVPGDTVQGKIIFVRAHRYGTIKGIIARIRCTGEIHFGRLVVDSVYHNTFYQKQYYVSGDGSNNDNSTHDPSSSSHSPSRSSSSYPFIFTLPSTGLPQSYTGQHGSVKYYIDAIGKLKHPPFTISSQAELEVHDQLNLNEIVPRDIVAGPIQLTFDNSNHFLSAGLNLLLGLGDDEALLAGSSSPNRRRGEIQAKLELEKRGFVPGEFIQFNVMIVNQTRKTLAENSLEFQQVIKYKAHNVTRDVVEVLARSDGPIIDPHSTNFTWTGAFEVPEGIPVSSPSNVASCITISYRLKVEIETGPLSRNLKYEYNILIGTIPFQNIPRRSRSIDYHIAHGQGPLAFGRDWGIDHPNFGEEGEGSPQPGLHRLCSQMSTDCPSYLDLADCSTVSSPPPPTYEEAVGKFAMSNASMSHDKD